MSQNKYERERFEKIDIQDGYYQLLLIEDDPLTFEQKNKIIDFIYPFFYATQRGITKPISFGELSIPPSDIMGVFKRAKPYHTVTEEEIRGLTKAADALPFSPLSLGEHVSFELFYDVLSHPEQHPEVLGIDPTQFSQVYAAAILMNAVFNAHLYVVEPGPDNYVSTTNPYGNVFAKYRHELCGESLRHKDGSQKITAKHKLLMKGEPVQTIKAHDTQPTPLDFLLARTHFKPAKWNKMTGMMTQYDQHGSAMHTEHWVEYKEESREIIRDELTRLYQHPDLYHVIAALGEILREQDKYLLFSGSHLNVGELGVIHNTRFDNAGFYDGGNAIVSAGIVIPGSLKVDKNNLGTIAHEALHLILDTLVQNACSPVVTPEDSIKLDQAILADQEHRGKIDYAALNADEKAVWGTVVHDLENRKSYFDGCSNEGKQQVMRVEVIVRPIERLAAGNTEASIRKIMPHVWAFYRQHCRPLIEEYLRQRGHSDRIIIGIQAEDAYSPNSEKQQLNPVPVVEHDGAVQPPRQSTTKQVSEFPERNTPVDTSNTRQTLSTELIGYQRKFNMLLAQISAFSQEEEGKFRTDLSQYYNRLNQAQASFFAHPQGDAFDKFNDICQRESLKLEIQLKNKASLWDERVSPLVKQILGCLLAVAAILISCGLFIVVMTTHLKIRERYQQTFFKKPVSKSVKQPIQEIKKVVDEINTARQATDRTRRSF